MTDTISLDEATKNWEQYSIWKIAPAGLTWIAEGARATIGEWAIIGEWATIGEGAIIGEGVIIGEGASISKRTSIGEGALIGANASDAVDLGWADGYRKCIAQVNGVAYIGAGCRWFSLADAINHWERNHPAGTRDLTLCLMRAAIHIADLRGWKLSEAA